MCAPTFLQAQGEFSLLVVRKMLPMCYYQLALAHKTIVSKQEITMSRFRNGFSLRFFRSFIFPTLLAGSLSACVSVMPAYVPPAPRALPTDPNVIARMTEKKHDDFKKQTSYQGINASDSTYSDNQIFLRSWKDDASTTASYQIYVETTYSGEWVFYNSAYDSNGKKLDFVSVARDVDDCTSYGCFYHEHLALNVDRNYLEANQETGVKFKISGKLQNGDKVLFLPPAFIKGFLMSMQ
jgi:hypothetical protein